MKYLRGIYVIFRDASINTFRIGAISASNTIHRIWSIALVEKDSKITENRTHTCNSNGDSIRNSTELIWEIASTSKPNHLPIPLRRWFCWINKQLSTATEKDVGRGHILFGAEVTYKMNREKKKKNNNKNTLTHNNDKRNSKLLYWTFCLTVC